MPVRFEEYDPEKTDILKLEKNSNAYKILSFLIEHPKKGFTPKEIHKETGIPKGSIGTTLSRLKNMGLVRHKKPYWSIEKDDRLAAYDAWILSMETAKHRFPEENRQEWLENAEDPRYTEEKDEKNR